MKIDAHQHFWKYNPREYGWIGPGMESLKRDFLPTDLLPLMKSAGICGTVAVQARQSIEETQWLLGLADEYAFIVAVVGWVDLRSPRIEEQLERFAAHPKLRSVRHVIHDEPDDQFMLRKDFMRGIKALSRYNLAYDLLLQPKHLSSAIKLAREFSEQPFILDHLAKPRIRDGVLAPWDRDMARLAECDNVSCKLSGMVTEAHGQTWTPEDFTPYMDVVFERFGADRVMVGSDWPVCTVAAAYEEVMGIAAEYINKLSPTERTDIWSENAKVIYQIHE
ncbi:MAG: amidohydrolase family protein [Candidatus Sumerlaeota bacterium]|nr:amidohydrolase family protein [Candidatus Sumerlaeota bacterium]